MSTDPFASFSEYYASVQSGDNEKIQQVTNIIKELEKVPGYCESLLRYVLSTEDIYFQQFLLISIKNQVQNYWENEQLYANKDQFRASLLEIMIRSTKFLLPLIARIITIISNIDYPEKWPQLMNILTSALNEAQLPAIYAILYTTTFVLKKYERQSSDPSYREIDNIVDYWGNPLIVLLSDVLHKQAACPELEECFDFCFQIIRSLCSVEMPRFIYHNLDKFLAFYHQFFTLPGVEVIKTTLCTIMKQYIIRYLHNIKRWGQSEDDKRTDEEIQNLQNLWFALYTDLLTIVNSTAIIPDKLIIAVFDALNALVRSNDKVFLVQQGNLENFCLSTLIPCVTLDDSDIEDFYNDSLNFFLHDIEGLESDSKRMSAQSFLKMIGRYFKAELANVFMGLSKQLLDTYNANPDQSWKEMDTAMFILEIVIAKVSHYNQGVVEVIETVNLPDFLNSFIIPQLSSKFPLLQADAIKFLVNFRNVIDPQMILSLFPNIINLIFINQLPVPLYATYFVERIMHSQQFNTPAGPILLTGIDVAAVVNRLFAIFTVDNRYNLIAARCLMRLVVYGATSIQPNILLIISSCVNYLIEICKNPIDPSFNHCLFEVIAAAVTIVKVPVPQIENEVIRLLDIIITNEITDFIPYVYQIIGCFLLNYPDEAIANQPFYVNQFATFLDPQRWMAMGNIPALAILVRAYCIRYPQLISENIPQIFLICENLLTKTRSHPHAFMIFVSIIRFLPKEFVFSILPQMYGLIFSQLPNPNLQKYRQSYAIFMSDACFFLEPDDALRFLGENAETMIGIWAESLPLVRGREELESAIAGCIKTLLNATVLTQPMWEQLFVGTVKMIESPSYDSIRDEIEVIKIEEQDAKQFDTSFSELVYAKVNNINPHPDLEDADLVQYMATCLAQYSHQHPGYLPDVINRTLEPHLKSSFISYEERFGIKFE